ncbi:hypothetical protein FRACYDRAFT_249592 [Fragilariopsis cylindrus CCMP1102]|uniref:Uncharacterized protein n=1 Tax=Fragilariopsis cylindrus CCMP1102 TaxID=635003 RepID=A0A1E7ES44_9STRA|nr:hypothetical protein FRACYDRAFT_249592 [Fragilariopsis cylindrus CCMP1102]|eukprot:OEU08692.1 hypothetical protein FRACYDRAFT_249592 [Fragilariopsis cylindrus CCMP1102]
MNPCVDHDQHDHDHDHDDNEEERGYSVRGLENETSSARKLRDDIYYRAKNTVLSIQEDIHVQIELLHDDFNNQIITNNKKMNNKNNQKSSKDDNNKDDDTTSANTSSRTSNRDTTTIPTEFTFATQYNEMSTILAEMYCDICHVHANDARQRGLYDEVTARKINTSLSTTTSEQQQQQQQNNVGAGVDNMMSSDNNNEGSSSVRGSGSDQRRPSTTIDADVAVPAALLDDDLT